jgi:hypothetical protein
MEFETIDPKKETPMDSINTDAQEKFSGSKASHPSQECIILCASLLFLTTDNSCLPQQFYSLSELRMQAALVRVAVYLIKLSTCRLNVLPKSTS